MNDTLTEEELRSFTKRSWRTKQRQVLDSAGIKYIWLAHDNSLVTTWSWIAAATKQVIDANRPKLRSII